MSIKNNFVVLICCFTTVTCPMDKGAARDGAAAAARPDTPITRVGQRLAGLVLASKSKANQDSPRLAAAQAAALSSLVPFNPHGNERRISTRITSIRKQEVKKEFPLSKEAPQQG